jgi:hypothetical protein
VIGAVRPSKVVDLVRTTDATHGGAVAARRRPAEPLGDDPVVQLSLARPNDGHPQPTLKCEAPESVLHLERELGLAGVSPVVVDGVEVGEGELGQVGGQLAAHPAGDVGAAAHHVGA